MGFRLQVQILWATLGCLEFLGNGQRLGATRDLRAMSRKFFCCLEFSGRGPKIFAARNFWA